MKAVKKRPAIKLQVFSSYRHHPNPRQILISRCFQLAEARSGLEFLVLLHNQIQGILYCQARLCRRSQCRSKSQVILSLVY